MRAQGAAIMSGLANIQQDKPGMESAPNTGNMLNAIGGFARPHRISNGLHLEQIVFVGQSIE
jgi:hypothetical protein